jgi:phosphatidylserine/phosphatidylglycerophosphate/cardiolipin synthase-like enzyme
MREPASGPGLTIQLISGTYVVLIGISVDPGQEDGLLGFAIERIDHQEGERGHLANSLLFELNDVGEDPDRSTEFNPVQAFVWGDYTAKPRHTYTYAVTAMYGTPARLRRGPTASARVRTEDPDDGTHGVFFNRGVAASAAYERRFQTQRPDKVPNREAYRWLSRGLEEAIVSFIGQAVDDRHALRAAMYEFEFESVLNAFKVADTAGADVRIVYDNVKGKTTGKHNAAAIKEAGLTGLAKARTKINIAHNKFIVLIRDGTPEQVWTGSTNITEGGIFGHANVGHRISDRAVAKSFLDYWERLSEDPAREAFKTFNDPPPAVPPGKPPKRSRTAVFSPRHDLDTLEWYVRLAKSADQAVFLTAAFGLGTEIAPVFAGDVKPLRYLLLDTERGDIEAVRRDPDNIVSAGGYKGQGAFRAWIAEALRHLNRLDYVHTKFMLIDPLSEDPLIVSGSANWSDESSKRNDENMLVIRGNQRAADIYLTDFMRIFSHYRLRGKAKLRADEVEPAHGGRGPSRARLHLEPDDSWARPFYLDGSPEAKERLLFSGAAG